MVRVTSHKDLLLTWTVAISAIVIAIQMIINYCKKLKYRRKIVLVTNGRGTLDADDTSDIAKKIKEDGMELVVMLGCSIYLSRSLLRHSQRRRL